MPRVRVDRGDGKLFNIAEGPELTAFKAANPGAHAVPGRSTAIVETPQEVAASAAALVSMPRRGVKG